MLYIRKKKELAENFKAIPLEKKQQLYRGVRSIVAMLVKISKMTELYSVRDKIFDEFTETLKQNFDVIHNTLSYATVTTKKVGFYYQEKKIKLFDEGERKFRNIFLVNEIRELYFTQGITPKEIVDFFAVIQETLNYTLLDYDFNTRLWDYGINSIGTISDPDMGDPEPWTEEEFKSEFEPVNAVSFFAFKPMSFHELASIVPQFDNIGKTKSSEFIEWVEKSGKALTVKKYLDRAMSIIASKSNKEENRALVNKICEYAVKNLQDGDFVSGIVYVNTLIQLTKSLSNDDEVLFMRVNEVLKRINSEEFIDNIFSLAAQMESSQLRSFGSLISFISSNNFEYSFVKLCELENTDFRVHSLERIAANFKDIALANKFTKDENWHIVRNFLYMLRFVFNPELLPAVRDVMNHQVKQIRIEAARVLSLYDADENLEYWQRAVFSPDEEVRVLAVENLIKVKGFEAKAIFNEIFKPSNRSKFNLTDYERYIDRILASNRSEFFDLPGTMIFSENTELRLTALKSLNKIADPGIIISQIIRRIKSPEFLELQEKEILLLLGLAKGSAMVPMLEAFEYLFNLQGGFLNKKKFAPVKKIVFDYFKPAANRNLSVKKWLEKGKNVGNSETKAIISGRGE
ncbi:MAG: HEAT repeat domain-containing protein [bacterium]